MSRPPELWSLKIDSACIESTPAVWRNWIWVGTRGGAMYGISERARPEAPGRREKRLTAVTAQPSPRHIEVSTSMMSLLTV